MIYRITHTTSYRYSELASISQNEVFLQPRQTTGQNVRSNLIQIDPIPNFDREKVDYFGNQSRYFMIQHPHSKLIITARSELETKTVTIPKAETTPAWETVRDSMRKWNGDVDYSAFQFVFPSPMIQFGTDIKEYALKSFTPGTSILAASLDLNHRIFTEFSYDKDATTVDTSVAQLFESKKGVCQDFAHFMIACFRSLGLSARYVSGYLETLPPPGKPKLIGSDATHAWVAVYIPTIGWIDLDPTNDQIPGEQHITVAWGRDYADVTPVKGIVMGGGSHQLSVSVEVTPLS